MLLSALSPDLLLRRRPPRRPRRAFLGCSSPVCSSFGPFDLACLGLLSLLLSSLFFALRPRPRPRLPPLLRLSLLRPPRPRPPRVFLRCGLSSSSSSSLAFDEKIELNRRLIKPVGSPLPLSSSLGSGRTGAGVAGAMFLTAACSGLRRGSVVSTEASLVS